VTREDLLAAIKVRLARRHLHEQELESAKSAGGFNPDFSSPKPLESLGLTVREAEVLLWIARGKSNRDIAEILDLSPRTVNKHLEQIYSKLGVENRASAATLAVRTIGIR
jgi:DNA-binding CsgD family transcriptional regulator